MTRATDRIVLSVPEGDLTVTPIELAAADRAAAAVSQAWAMVDPGFALAVERSTDLPARDGWDEVGQTSYVTLAEERRTVVALARRADKTWYVALIDGRQQALGRRGAQLGTMVSSFRAKGQVSESFAGKKANPLDADRLAKLETFIEEASQDGQNAGSRVSAAVA